MSLPVRSTDDAVAGRLGTRVRETSLHVITLSFLEQVQVTEHIPSASDFTEVVARNEIIQNEIHL